MNGKKARAARKALARSTSSSSSRLGRKAARVEKSAVERVFDVEMGKLRRARDEDLAAAAEVYRKALGEAKDAHREAQQAAWVAYDAGRDELVTKLAAAERVAA